MKFASAIAGGVVTATNDKTVVRGATTWQVPVGSTAATADANTVYLLTVVAAEEPKLTLLAFDKISGKQTWSLTLGVADTEIDVHSLAIRGNTLLVLDADELYSVTLSEATSTI